ncbi:MAG TPA: ABC transporter ATP-binding protein [Acidimicrobiales bacterium]|nr:ABC transporter ATP-binding protein [Acidimicrobiales bacterium]
MSTVVAPLAADRVQVSLGQWALSVSNLSKRFGPVRAIDDLTFTVEPGEVCGFLGPNGAGKTTTLRCLLGLIAPTAGLATIGGRRYVDLSEPLATVGAVLDASSFHPGRSARNHLRVLCSAAGFDDARADAVLETVGLTDAARRRVGTFSTGMRQRLGLAAALLGDPAVLVLDEPATGLDPAGINWLRELLRYLAHDRGKTVLLSSHLLSEMEHTADRVVIISEGRLVREGSLSDLVGRAAATVRARTPQPELLRDVLEQAGYAVDNVDHALLVNCATPDIVGHLAFTHGVEIAELTATHEDLEDVFLELTGGQPRASASPT